jgi:hypothetical protein
MTPSSKQSSKSGDKQQLKAWCAELDILAQTSKLNLKAFADEHTAKYQKFCSQWKDNHKSLSDGQTITWHLTKAQEPVLVAWLVFLAKIGQPQSHHNAHGNVSCARRVTDGDLQ